MKNCFLFPGQGAQYPGMAKDFFETSKAVRELFDLASEISGTNMRKLLFESDEETLKQTQNTQLAIALAGAAAALSAREHDMQPAGCAGFSVGEYPALAEAGIISFADMFHLVSERGRLMDESGRRSGSSTMTAVLFMPPEKIQQTLDEAGLKHVWIANYNSATQSVLSGTTTEIEFAEEKLKAAGARRVVRLKVSGAFHSPLMAWAHDAFSEVVGKVTFQDPRIAFFSNVTGKRVLTGKEAKSLAVAQVISPVLWTTEEASIAAEGFDCCLETGPGTVLAGLWKSTESSIVCHPCDTLDALASISL
ncbi:MAG: ACP S-malonyltransferase [Spirochaetaceae bacterium]|nr:ACP S-malonyltransferase [Spirochaetaceae bacterium]